MLDLIDRNAMLKTLENSGVLGEFAKFLIKKQPAVDAVEVVRCKNCKYNGTNNCPTFNEAFDGKDWQTLENNDYCSYGERKDE